MRFRAAEIAEAVVGRLIGPDVDCRNVSIDSRTIGAGALFVPIVAERDGHDFIESAINNGASVYLTEREPAVTENRPTAIVVDDTQRALADLAKLARRRHQGPVIAITGSVGKTTVKDLTAAAIGTELTVHASEKSFNNELGVPLTLCNAPDGTDVLVIEMGARGVGHIDDLCAIASPTLGVVTWVGAVHTSEFGSIEAVAQAKGELVQALPADGTAVLNIDNDHVAAMAERSFASVLRYSVEGRQGANATASGIELDDDLRSEFTAVVAGQRQRVALPARGRHQVSNALAAIAAGHAIGVPLEPMARGLRQVELSPWRMELQRSPLGARVLNDAYNANAVSTEAALRSLADLSARRRIAVLGVMAELGDRHDADHQAMTELANELDIEVIAFREPAYGIDVADSFGEIIDRIGELRADDAVLVKGSRVAGLETLAELLTAGG